MVNDKLYTKNMLNHISSDTNLQNDINAYMYAAYTGNTSLFAGYVGASYDTSADYELHPIFCTNLLNTQFYVIFV